MGPPPLLCGMTSYQLLLPPSPAVNRFTQRWVAAPQMYISHISGWQGAGANRGPTDLRDALSTN